MRQEPFDRWLARSLIRYWLVGLVVVWCFGWADWDSDVSLAENLIFAPLAAVLIWGLIYIVLLTLSVLIYLGALAVVIRDQPPLLRRLIAVSASPLIALPWWIWAWEHRSDDPGFLIFLAVLCLAVGLTVPFRRSVEPDRRRLEPRPT